jgi:hypothetical protein
VGGGFLDDREELRTKTHGSARIVEHPVLGELPPAATAAFVFNGLPVEGRAGEPIAAALLATGHRVFRTMPRYGDARGGYCMVGRCADCLVVVNGVTNVRACVTPVAEGLDVRTQHGLGERDGELLTVSEP